VIHYEEALYQVYAPLPLPLQRTLLITAFNSHKLTDRLTDLLID